jgi:prepilin-type N-terminal cleavage/methylation domain-containing protein
MLHCTQKTASRLGMTLLELVVVMAILATLAGLLVPLMPYLVDKARTSSSATNLNEISKAVQTFAARNRDMYPNQLDSLIDATGAIPAFIPNGELSTDPVPLTAGDLGDADFASLKAAGITKVAQMRSTASNPTFGPNPSTNYLVDLSAASKVALLNATVARSKFGVSEAATARYIVFGLGLYATMAGKSMNKPPVASNSAEGYGPNQKYCRFGLVFRTTDRSGVAMPRAKFVGAIQLTGLGLMVQDDNLESFYKLKQQ